MGDRVCTVYMTGGGYSGEACVCVGGGMSINISPGNDALPDHAASTTNNHSLQLQLYSFPVVFFLPLSFSSATRKKLPLHNEQSRQHKSTSTYSTHGAPKYLQSFFLFSNLFLKVTVRPVHLWGRKQDINRTSVAFVSPHCRYF